MPWTPSGVSSLKSVTVNVPWETIISAWTFDQPEKVSVSINLVSMFGLFLCWACGTFNIQPVASISFLLGKCTPHLSYCLHWNRATSPEKRRGGNASAQPEELLYVEMHWHGPLLVEKRGGVMGKISRSDLAGLWMSQSGTEVGLTKEWKLSRKTQMIMNCSLCLNSHPQIVLQRTLSSYLSQSEVYRSVIFRVICSGALCEHLEKITTFADKQNF